MFAKRISSRWSWMSKQGSPQMVVASSPDKVAPNPAKLSFDSRSLLGSPAISRNCGKLSSPMVGWTPSAYVCEITNVWDSLTLKIFWKWYFTYQSAIFPQFIWYSSHIVLGSSVCDNDDHVHGSIAVSVFWLEDHIMHVVQCSRGVGT